MTTIRPIASDGGDFAPLTLIRAEEVNSELDTITDDLNYLASELQNLATKLDTIEPYADAPLNPDEVIALINSANAKIDISHLSSDVQSGGDISIAIANHRTTTNSAQMHPETAIKSTELPYGSTPTTLLTTCANLQDELKNIRYVINRLIGKSTWVDNPTESLNAISTALDAVESKLSGIESGATQDMSASEIRAALWTVDGVNSLIDADKLDGQEGTYYATNSGLSAHIGNSSNPHGVTKAQVGLAAITPYEQLRQNQLETGSACTDRSDLVPSSHTVISTINNKFKDVVIWPSNGADEGGQINFASSLPNSYRSQHSIDRYKDTLRIFAIDESNYGKIIMIPQTASKPSNKKINYTQYLMSVPSCWASTTTNGSDGSICDARDYWSSTTPNTVIYSYPGPLIVTGGTVSFADGVYSEVVYSWDGVNWGHFKTSIMGTTPYRGDNNLRHGNIPPCYVDENSTLYIKIISTWSSQWSSSVYGGAFSLSYVRV